MTRGADVLVDDIDEVIEPARCAHFSGDALAGFAVAGFTKDGEDRSPDCFGGRLLGAQAQAGAGPCHTSAHFGLVFLAAGGDDR